MLLFLNLRLALLLTAPELGIRDEESDDGTEYEYNNSSYQNNPVVVKILGECYRKQQDRVNHLSETYKHLIQDSDEAACFDGALRRYPCRCDSSNDGSWDTVKQTHCEKQTPSG